MSGRLHDDELPVDEQLVRRLLDESVPELAHQPLRRVDSTGSTNALFRLGHDLVVRVPRQPGGGSTILKEAHWLPRLAPRLTVRVPAIVHVGEPGGGYPERWCIARWIDGRPPAAGAGGAELADSLAAVIDSIRTVELPEDVADPSLRWYRGGPLAAIDESLQRALDRCRDRPGLELDLDRATTVWADAVDLSRRTPGAPTTWFHSDLVAENLLLDEHGRLAAVLDFGGLAVGDPTVELHGAWELLDPGGRRHLRTVLDVDEPTWILARAWALAIAVMTFDYYWDTLPRRCADRLVMARAVLDDVGRS